jgi:hypothetical protein
VGFDPRLLRPADRIGRLRVPVLLITGAADAHASEAEMQQLYGRAHEPKELWVIVGAHHVDFQKYSPAEYEQRVTGFPKARLSVMAVAVCARRQRSKRSPAARPSYRAASKNSGTPLARRVVARSVQPLRLPRRRGE